MVALDTLFKDIEAQIKLQQGEKETDVQQILTEAKSRCITELEANIYYHKALAQTLTDSGNLQRALRHTVLAEVYGSMLKT